VRRFQGGPGGLLSMKVVAQVGVREFRGGVKNLSSRHGAESSNRQVLEPKETHGKRQPALLAKFHGKANRGVAQALPADTRASRRTRGRR